MALSQSFFARSLASAIAAVSVMALANNADAANLANYSAQGWNGKSTDLGTFGAGYNAGFTTDLTNGALVGTAWANNSIQIFGTKVTIAELIAAANINTSNSQGGSVIVKAVGATIYNPSYSASFNYSTPEYCTSFFDVSTTMNLGVVPVTLFASAEGCASLGASAAPSYNTTTHEGKLSLVATPLVDIDLTVGAGVGTRGFSVGIEAPVTLFNASFPITVDPTYNFSTTYFTATNTGKIALTNLLGGSFDVYASIDLGFWDAKYTSTIFEWEGISKDWTLWATGIPSATNLAVNFTGQKAVGTYTFNDTANLAESGSTYKWYRNSSDVDTGKVDIYDTDSTHLLTADDAEKYLQYCVLPRNTGGSAPLVEQCSDWTSVGKMAILYPGSSYGTLTGGSHVALAYEKVASNLCFNMSDMYWESPAGYPFDNAISSYKLYAPTGQQATFKFYQNANCSTSTTTDYVSKDVSAASSSLQTSITTGLGTGWDNTLSSFKVVYIDEDVAASNVSVTISGNKATGNYTFQVSDNAISTTESGSTYQWYRAADATGFGSNLISTSTTAQHTITINDYPAVLKFCVTPSNGTTMGDQVCSDWTSIGHILNLYETNNEQGQQVAIAWEKSLRETCFNLSDYSFDNKISSYAFYNNSVAASTIWYYKDANCTGTVATRTVSSGTDQHIGSISSAMGSGWDDSISSFKVSWNSSINISTPTLTFSANKATESHTYSGGLGYSESGTTYTWYRAFDSAGNGKVPLENFNQNTYELTGADSGNYLKVCVLGANAMMVDDATMCSNWMFVGPLISFYSDLWADGVNMNFAYERTPSGMCFNMTPYGFNNVISSVYLDPGTYPFPRAAKVEMFKDNWCVGPSQAVGVSTFTQLTGQFNDAVSSVRVIY